VKSAKPRFVVGATGIAPWMADAVVAAGGEVVEDPATADAVVWTDPFDVDGLRAVLAQAPNARWVQLTWAGVEHYAAGGIFGDGRTWTSGKGVYAEPCAEHALALLLAGLRDLPERIRATRWGRQSGRSLYDGRVTILGGGGITEALIPLLAPLRVTTTVVRRRPDAMTGVDRVMPPERLHDALADADAVVLALALTPETEGVIGRPELERMPDHAWLVNVARGRHVVTDDLVAALKDHVIGGAGLDVTDPEPLPDGHPLWDLPNCIITPHTANTLEMARPMLTARITENVRRFMAGEPLIGVVDPDLGY
jgi:phosphoglycerate dehydrogenase-like enzyme